MGNGEQIVEDVALLENAIYAFLEKHPETTNEAILHIVQLVKEKQEAFWDIAMKINPDADKLPPENTDNFSP